MANNTTDLTFFISKPNIGECIVLMMSCAIAGAANIFVMVLMFLLHRLKSSNNMFVLSLCLCNSIISLVVIPMRTFIVRKEIYAMLAYKYIVIITTLIYICNLTAVSRHRLLCIIDPLTYVQRQTKRQVMKIVVTTWIVPLCYGVLPVIWFKPKSMSDLEKLIHTVYKLLTLAFLLAPFAFMLFVFSKVCTQVKNIRKQIPSSSPLTDLLNNFECQNADTNGVQKAYLECKMISSRSKRKLSRFLSPSKDHECEQNVLPSVDNRSQPDTQLPEEYLSATPTGLDGNSVVKEIVCTPGHNTSTQWNKHDQLCKLKDRFSSTYDTIHPLIPDVRVIRPHSSGSERQCNSILNHCDNRDHRNTSFCLPPTHIGYRLHHRRAAIPAKLSSLASRRSLHALQEVIQRKASELRASLAFFIVAVGYMVTWIPVVALTLIDIIDRDLVVPTYVEIASLFTMSFNALLDPFLYWFLLPSFRKILKLSLRRRRDKQSISKQRSRRV